MNALAALALTATLYHCLNHAFFKSLLFLGTGSVLHATGERNLGKLGGLIHRMPWVAWLAAGRRARQRRPAAAERLRLRMAAAAELPVHARPAASATSTCWCRSRPPLIALVAALAGYTMVKFFGIIFLGQPREEKLAQAHDAGMLGAHRHVWLAAGCVLLGVLPGTVIAAASMPVTRQLIGAGLGDRGARPRLVCWRRSRPSAPATAR